MKLTLKEWRRAKGVSIESMAKALGVSFSTVMRWENSGVKMPVDKAVAYCDYLKIDLDDVNFCA